MGVSVYFILEVGDIWNLKVGERVIFEGAVKLRIKCLIAVVFFVEEGFGGALERVKIFEIDVDGAYFCDLRGFRCYCEEGVWGFLEGWNL